MITRVYIKNFRSLKEKNLIFKERIVFFTGKNNQGKTSILEALYLLGSGRYLTEKESDHLIHDEQKQSLIACEWKAEENHQLYFRFEKPNKLAIVFNKKTIKKKNVLSKMLYIQYLSAESNQAFQASPNHRRQFFNSFFSSLDSSYNKNLKKYMYYVNQKNKFLKKDQLEKKGLNFLNQQLISTAVDLVENRIDLLKKFEVYFKKKKNKLISEHFSAIEFKYKLSRLESFAEFDRDSYKRKLEEKVKEDENKEKILGYSLVGPHRDDYDVVFQNKSLFRYASRGINRVFSIAMYGESMKWITSNTKQKLCFLADDIFSELDNERQKWVAEYMCSLDQVFLAGVSRHELSLFTKLQHFEVLQGDINETA